MLLSGAMRASEFSGQKRPVQAWFAGRQAGPWVYQYWDVPPETAKALKQLDDLHKRGVIDDAELARARAKLGA
jgi:hypothetical protein